MNWQQILKSFSHKMERNTAPYCDKLTYFSPIEQIVLRLDTMRQHEHQLNRSISASRYRDFN